MLIRRFHPYWKNATMTALGEVGENPIFLGNYLLRFLRMMILLSIWRMIYSGRGVHSGMDLNAVLTYTLISGIFAEQLDCRTTLYSSMWEGGIATRFVRPMGLFSQFITEMFGRWWLGLCLFSLPVLLCAPLLGVNPLPVSVSAGLLFILSLVLSITVGIAVDFLFGALLMVMENSLYEVEQIRKAVVVLLSGSLIPLALMPWRLGEIFDWLPFASMVSAPLRIYTGTGEPFQLLMIQAMWALILWPGVALSWKWNRERLVCYGG